MRLNKEGWVYRIAKLGFGRHPSDSLCVFFWQFVTGCIMGLFMICLVAALACMVIYITIAIPVHWFVPTEFWTAGAITGAFLWVAILGGALFDMVKKRKAKEGPKIKYEGDPSPLSLFWAFIKAKKEKVCPKIEFYYKD